MTSAAPDKIGANVKQFGPIGAVIILLLTAQGDLAAVKERNIALSASIVRLEGQLIVQDGKRELLEEKVTDNKSDVATMKMIFATMGQRVTRLEEDSDDR